MEDSVSLNPQQYRASRPDGGITLVIAGAGTGKTKTMVRKIKNIIISGHTPAENILVLTFSNRAAGEIRQRVADETGGIAAGVTAGTFHSFCFGFLRNHGQEFLAAGGYKTLPRVFDDGEKRELLKGIVQSRLDDFLGFPTRVIMELLETKNISDVDRKKLAGAGILQALEGVKESLRRYKIAHGLIDFEDMLDTSIELLTENERLRREMRSRYRYIFVDEYQDTSTNNFQLLKCLVPEKNANLFVVGDDWQSIYGFRDSRVEYIVAMKKYFPGVKTHRLTVNYRSRNEIVKLSSRFIKKNRFRTSKRLSSHKGRGGTVKALWVKDFKEEVPVIESVIEGVKRQNLEVAILYRNNWQGDYILKNSCKVSSLVDAGQVSMMTMHGSKGLEFEMVILAGIADAVIPDAFTDIEEERRLFYVALTRAKESLYCVFHQKKDGTIPVFAKELGHKLRKIPGEKQQR